MIEKVEAADIFIEAGHPAVTVLGILGIPLFTYYWRKNKEGNAPVGKKGGRPFPGYCWDKHGHKEGTQEDGGL